jgi:hypothetical protein
MRLALLIASSVSTLIFVVSFYDNIKESHATVLETAFRSTYPVLTPCNTAAAFVLDSGIVAMFTSSVNCTFPLFPDVAPLPLAKPNGTFDVTVFVIGGGGGGGSNGGGGGGAGGLTVQTVQISMEQSISVVVGLGGTPAAFLSAPTATQGQDTSLTFSGTSVIAQGGGFGGSRGWNSVNCIGGTGGCGGGGGGGGCDNSFTCGAPSTAGGSGSNLQGYSGGEGYKNNQDGKGDALCQSAGAGGGGFGQAGTAASSCSGGNGGNGFQLPFAPIMSSWVAGGGAGALTCYSQCSNPMFGTNGLGQRSFGGGGQGGCGSSNGGSPPAECNPQPGSTGVAFIKFAFTCPAGFGAVSGFFSASPCAPCLPGSFSSEMMFCLPCPTGQFSNLTNASVCLDCPAHTYNPIEGSDSISACLPCPNGTCTSTSGSTNASACEPCPLPATNAATSLDAPSLVPLWIVGSAAASSGHFPRVLELVQFLSIYCTTLASQQQQTITAFQIGSFTGALVTSRQEYCGICPGYCLQPLVLVMPTFALLSSLSVIMSVTHVCIRRAAAKATISATDHLLAGESAVVAPVAMHRPITLRQKLVDFAIRYYRNLIEMSSSYVLIPAMFVFVLNAWPSSFFEAGVWDRVMTVMIPVLALYFRAFVILKQFVDLTSDDQKQLFVSSACYCCIAVTLGAFFMLNRDALYANPNSPFPSHVLPQCIVLALLIIQLIAHTIIRHKSTKPSALATVQLPWRVPGYDSSSTSSRVAVRMMRFARCAAITSAAQFLINNYLALSQIAMVTAGLISSFAPWSSGSRSYAASVAIGSIPLVISGVLLLRAAARCMGCALHACCGRKESRGSKFQMNSQAFRVKSLY